MADDRQKGRKDSERHWVRDALLTSVIAAHTAGPAPITTARVQTADSSPTQSSLEFSSQSADREEAELAEIRRIQQEQALDRALDSGLLLHRNEAVEERAHSRDER